jgi:type IV pilus assembly protein PilE
MRANNLHRGFTLIEVMIVVVIIGILAGISYPSYRSYMVQSRRSDAQVALSQAANQQERYFTECNRYAQTLAGARLCTATGVAATDVLGISGTSPTGDYTLSVAQGNITGTCSGAGQNWNCGYTLTATPTLGGRQVGNGALRIDATGVKQWDKPGGPAFGARWTDK